jgi:glycosyltransferase involved in cell wall biosynthesis
MGLPPVSLILPNRNNAPVLGLVLDRLAQHTTYPDVELIVVDDGSTDASVEILRSWRDRRRFAGEVQLIEAEHRGVAASLNAALARASGELVVSLDGDATVETPGWLERMVAFAASDPLIGAVCGSVVLDTGRVHAMGVNVVCPEGMHDRPTTITEPEGGRTLHCNVIRPRPPHAAAIAEVDAAIGCYLLYNRAAAMELGGYDTGYAPVWFEDLDLTMGLRRLGSKVFFLPEVEIVHRQSLRNSRDGDGGSPQVRAARRFRRAIGPAVPGQVKQLVVAAAGLDRPSPQIRARLRSHYAHWRRRWGFDPVNPRMDDVLRRWGDTEICWAYDPARRRAGEAIAARYAERDIAASA